MAKYSNFTIKSKRYVVICTVVSVAFTIAWWRFVYWDRLGIDAKLPFGEGFNPPSISFSLYAILWIFTLFFLGKLVELNDNVVVNKVWEALAFVGQHTLYIFMYHSLLLFKVIPFVSEFIGIEIDNIWIKRVVYFAVMIGGSMFIEFLINKCEKRISMIYYGTVKVEK